MYLHVLFALSLAFLATAQAQSCENPLETCDPQRDHFPGKISIQHATQIIDLEFFNTYVEFTVLSSATTSNPGVFKYRLVRCGCPPGDPDTDRQVLFTSPTGIHVGEGPVLGLMSVIIPDLPVLKYINVVDFVFSPQVRRRVANDQVLELGVDSFIPQYEKLKTTSIDLSIIGSFEVANYVAAETEKPFLVVSEVLEQTPLGRAEWMKIIALVLGKQDQANTEFQKTETTYNEARDKAFAIRRVPSVFLNFPRPQLDGRIVWTFPGELQYITRFLRDANVDYRFANNNSTEGTDLGLKRVRQDFGSARYLLNSGGFFPLRSDANLTEYINGDGVGRMFNMPIAETLKKLDAVRCGNVWDNTKRISEDKMASDFFELATFRPDLILQDFVFAVHPTINIVNETFFSYSLGKASEELVGGSCPYTELDGDLPDGMRYVDKEFSIKGLTRFDVEDKLAEDVLPKLMEAMQLDSKSVELFFPNVSAPGATDTNAVVRALVPEDRALALNESDTVLTTLQDSLEGGEITETESSIVGGPVEGGVEVNPPEDAGSNPEDGADSDADDDDDGLGGGGVAGIVISSLIIFLIIAVTVAVYFRRRSRFASAAVGESYWNDAPGEPGNV